MTEDIPKLARSENADSGSPFYDKFALVPFDLLVLTLYIYAPRYRLRCILPSIFLPAVQKLCCLYFYIYLKFLIFACLLW